MKLFDYYSHYCFFFFPLTFFLVALLQASHHLLFNLLRGSLLTPMTPPLKTVCTTCFFKYRNFN